MSSGFNLSDQTNPTWQQRADLCAAMISRVSEPGERISVADVGCGDMKLRNALEGAGLQVDYYGFDLRPQAVEITPFDLNRDKLPRKFDVVTVLGVIEYLDDVSFALRMASRASRYFVLSYVPCDLSGLTMSDASRLGWSNCMSRMQMEAILQDLHVSAVAKEVTPDKRTMLWLCAKDR